MAENILDYDLEIQENEPKCYYELLQKLFPARKKYEILSAVPYLDYFIKFHKSIINHFLDRGIEFQREEFDQQEKHKQINEI